MLLSSKQAFVTALDDVPLQLRVMEKEPKNIEDALSIASKLEAYEVALKLQGVLRYPNEGKGRHKLKGIYSVDSDRGNRDALCSVSTTDS